jgi:hypothetical protein
MILFSASTLTENLKIWSICVTSFCLLRLVIEYILFSLISSWNTLSSAYDAFGPSKCYNIIMYILGNSVGVIDPNRRYLSPVAIRNGFLWKFSG